MQKIGITVLLVLFLLFSAFTAAALPDIEVKALFKKGAVLVIDGEQQMLRVGQQTPGGVRIIDADARSVLLEYQGQQHRLGLSQHIAGSYQPVEVPEVTISRDKNNQYLTYAALNNKRTTVLIDTGANIVAMSSRQAKSLGISYKKGVQLSVRTASGVTPAYSIILRSVGVGPIRVSGVEAVVIEGEYPHYVLLGMSYLSQTEMSESQGVMTLRRKF